MKYTSAAAFRQALEQRLKNEAASAGLGLARLRKRVAFELFLRRLLAVAPNRWVLKGATTTSRPRSATGDNLASRYPGAVRTLRIWLRHLEIKDLHAGQPRNYPRSS